MLTSFTADHIRTLYTTGLYHKADLYLRFVYELKTPNTLDSVLNYSIYKDVRTDLQMKVFGMPFVHELLEDYHKELRHEAVSEHAAMIEDPANAVANFANVKRRLDAKASEKLKFLNEEFGFSFTVYDIQSRL